MIATIHRHRLSIMCDPSRTSKQSLLVRLQIGHLQAMHNRHPGRLLGLQQ
jgi:hypothetical protein